MSGWRKRATLAELPARDAELIRLYTVEHWTMQRIADKFAMTRAGVWQRLKLHGISAQDGEHAIIPCYQCAKPIKVYRSRLGRPRFCNNICRSKSRSRAIINRKRKEQEKIEAMRIPDAGLTQAQIDRIRWYRAEIERAQDGWHNGLPSHSNVYNGSHDACPICHRSPVQGLDWDHDHTTGQFRGYICGSCNRAIGLFGDDPERLIRAIAYLTKQTIQEPSSQLGLFSASVGASQSAKTPVI